MFFQNLHFGLFFLLLFSPFLRKISQFRNKNPNFKTTQNSQYILNYLICPAHWVIKPAIQPKLTRPRPDVKRAIFGVRTERVQRATPIIAVDVLVLVDPSPAFSNFWDRDSSVIKPSESRNRSSDLGFRSEPVVVLLIKVSISRPHFQTLGYGNSMGGSVCIDAGIDIYSGTFEKKRIFNQ